MTAKARNTRAGEGVATVAAFGDSLADPQAAAETLTEDERAYFRRTFDATRAATEAASAAVEALGRAEGANASYRDYLWEKYGLGPADAINAESGIIVRRSAGE